MKSQHRHLWNVSVAEGIAIQRELAGEVISEGAIDEISLVAGVDISVPKNSRVAYAAVVMLEYPGLEIVESQLARRELEFPYVPGLLSFRELPVILDAVESLSRNPDLIMVDGQGIAHPRRFGLASHLGVLLGLPTIGCAKSRLCGEHSPPGSERGEWVELFDDQDKIGAVLRTRTNVRPVYVSIGHRIDLTSAVRWVLNCGKGYRLPEPTRLAHLAAGSRIVGRW